MTNSEILNLFAQANRDAARVLKNDAYSQYADMLENAAAVKKAEEILTEKDDGQKRIHRRFGYSGGVRYVEMENSTPALGRKDRRDRAGRYFRCGSSRIRNGA